MSAELNPGRRAELNRKFELDRRHERRRLATPEIEADEESLRLTAQLSSGAGSNPIVGPIIANYVKGPFTLADYSLLAVVLSYIHSNLTRRGPAPWRANGYSDEQIVDRTETRWLAQDRVDRYAELLESVGLGRAGQVEVVLHGKGAPRVTGGENRTAASVAFPIIPNPVIEIPSTIADVGIRLASEECEPAFAWPLSRIVIRLMSLFASECLFCPLLDNQLRHDRGSHPDHALVVGRGQRVHVFPVCVWCVQQIERPYYDDDRDPNVLTFMGNDDFLAQVGHPEQKWY